MKKRKVTLSLDDKVYVDFQKYCEENAIMLSKKVELFMKEFMKNKKLAVFFMLLISLLLINVAHADVVERGANWNKIDKGNESYSLEIYNKIINSLNGSEYIPIDTQIKPSNYSNFIYELTSTPYGAYFRNNSNTAEPVRFEKDGYFFTYDISDGAIQWREQPGFPARTDTLGGGAPSNSQDSFAVVDNNILTYPDSFYNTNVTYTLSNDMLKESFILSGLPSIKDYVYLEYTGRVYFNRSLKICANDQCYIPSGTEDNFYTDGKIEFKDEDNVTIFYLKEPIITDSNGTSILGVYYVHGSDAQMGFDLRINKTFLETAVFPIYVDPTVKITGEGGGGDARVGGDSPNGNFGSDDELHVKWGTPKDNSYLEFNISSIPPNQVIESALLCLYLFNDQGSPNSSIYHVYADWQEDVITWNNQPCGTDFDLADNCSLAHEDTVFTDDNQDDTWQCWNITNMTRYEYEQSIERISMALHTWEGGYSDKFYSKEYANSSLWPYLNITYTLLDSISPNLTIESPLPQDYNIDSILVNLSAEDSNLDTTWWFNGTDNLTYASEIYYTFQEESNIIIAYANDSVGNENSSSVGFYVDSIAPEVSISLPQEGVSYGYNESIALNYSASDLNLGECWYNINNGDNISLSNCQNASFDVSGNGNYVLNLYANDSLGNLGSGSVSFSVQVGAPTITINYPIDSYLSSNNITFSYTPSDIDLQTCELWGNFDGEFKLNQTDDSPANSTENTFALDLLDGAYLWNIRCNDSQGNSAFNGNKTFYVDTIAPNVSLHEPVGAKSSKTVSASWSVSDENLNNCWYNVYRGENIEVSNTTISCDLNSTTFNVTVDASFVFNFYVSDFAGNTNFTSSLFSVSTSTPLPDNPPGGGGSTSSGGSSGGSNVSFYKLEIKQLPGMIVEPGETKKLTLSIKNIGNKFLNDCKIRGYGEKASWVVSEATKGLSVGEEYDFFLTLKIPEKLGAGLYDIGLETFCKEYSQFSNITAEIIEKRLAIDMTNFERNKNNLKIIYSLAELSGYEQEVRIEIALFDYNNERIAELTENKTIKVNSNENFEAILDIPASLSGNFNLLINAISDTSSTFVQEEIILGSTRTGLAILGGGTGDLVFSIFLIALFAIFAVIILKRIFRLKKLKKNKIKLSWRKKAI